MQLNVIYILNKISLTAQDCIISFYSKDMFILNTLSIKMIVIRRNKTILCFYGRGLSPSLPHLMAKRQNLSPNIFETVNLTF